MTPLLSIARHRLAYLLVGLVTGLAAGATGVVYAGTAHGTASSPPASASPSSPDPLLALTQPQQPPVLTSQSPAAEGNLHGFEGGRVVKVGGTYYMFTSEMYGNPDWIAMRLAYWTSTDAVHWTRGTTLYQSSGDTTGTDPRAALWSPIPVYDSQSGHWNLFYVAYYAKPPQYSNFNGRIWRAVSTIPGPNGITGPYKDAGIVMQPGPQSADWEGLQGVDSFMPYRVGNHWYALYGSANLEDNPLRHWRVGLATAPSLAGPWTRVYSRSPLTAERRFLENPIVTKLDNGEYAAVYDSELNGAAGVMYSKDGIHWYRGTPLQVLPISSGRAADDVRTPLGLVPEQNGTYTLLFTGNNPADGYYGDVYHTVVTSCRTQCTIDDAVEGPSFGQFIYDGNGWQHHQADGAFDGTASTSTTANDAVTFAFRGSHLSLRGITGPDEGIGSVTIDGHPAGQPDFYSAQPHANVPLWTSPPLGAGEHIFRLRVTGTKNPQSSGSGISIDAVTMMGGSN